MRKEDLRMKEENAKAYAANGSLLSTFIGSREFCCPKQAFIAYWNVFCRHGSTHYIIWNGEASPFTVLLRTLKCRGKLFCDVKRVG